MAELASLYAPGGTVGDTYRDRLLVGVGAGGEYVWSYAPQGEVEQDVVDTSASPITQAIVIREGQSKTYSNDGPNPLTLTLPAGVTFADGSTTLLVPPGESRELSLTGTEIWVGGGIGGGDDCIYDELAKWRPSSSGVAVVNTLFGDVKVASISDNSSGVRFYDRFEELPLTIGQFVRIEIVREAAGANLLQLRTLDAPGGTYSSTLRISKVTGSVTTAAGGTAGVEPVVVHSSVNDETIEVIAWFAPNSDITRWELYAATAGANQGTVQIVELDLNYDYQASTPETKTPGGLDTLTAKLHSVHYPSKGQMTDLSNQGRGLNPVVGDVTYDADGNAVYGVGVRSSVNTDGTGDSLTIYALVKYDNDADNDNSVSVLGAVATFLPIATSVNNGDLIRINNVSDANPFSIDGVTGFTTRGEVFNAINIDDFVIFKVEGVANGTELNIGSHPQNGGFHFTGSLKGMVIVEGPVDEADDIVINHALRNGIDPLRLSRIACLTDVVADIAAPAMNNGGGGNGPALHDYPETIVITEPTALRFEHEGVVAAGGNAYFTFGTAAGSEADGIGSVGSPLVRISDTVPERKFEIRVQPGTYFVRLGAGGGSSVPSSSLKITKVETGHVDISDIVEAVTSASSVDLDKEVYIARADHVTHTSGEPLRLNGDVFLDGLVNASIETTNNEQLIVPAGYDLDLFATIWGISGQSGSSVLRWWDVDNGAWVGSQARQGPSAAAPEDSAAMYYEKTTTERRFELRIQSVEAGVNSIRGTIRIDATPVRTVVADPTLVPVETLSSKLYRHNAAIAASANTIINFASLLDETFSTGSKVTYNGDGTWTLAPGRWVVNGHLRGSAAADTGSTWVAESSAPTIKLGVESSWSNTGASSGFDGGSGFEHEFENANPFTFGIVNSKAENIGRFSISIREQTAATVAAVTTPDIENVLVFAGTTDLDATLAEAPNNFGYPFHVATGGATVTTGNGLETVIDGVVSFASGSQSLAVAEGITGNVFKLPNGSVGISYSTGVTSPTASVVDLGDGTRIMRGKHVSTTNSVEIISFPASFANTNYSFVATVESNQSNYVNSPAISARTVNTLGVVGYTATGGQAAAGEWNFDWIAIGETP